MIISIDWFQISVFIDINQWKNIEKLLFYNIKKENYSTKIFRNVYTISDGRQNKNIATITTNPNSPIIKNNLAILKFDNWLLYQNYCKEYILQFLKDFNLVFNSISRIDICNDFNYFNYRKTDPSKFIKNFLNNKIVKIRRSKGQVYFEQGDKLDFQYIKFGSGTSRICSYIYNKTKELDQVKEKPYIREFWKKNKLSGTIWRCEFRIQNFDFILIDSETGEIINYNGNLSGLNSIDILDNGFELFYALSNHYLKFKIAGVDSNKSRLNEFKLFENPNQKLFKKVYNDNIESSRAEKIFIKKLYELNNELRGSYYDLGQYGDEVLKNVINATELKEWAITKGITLNN